MQTVQRLKEDLKVLALRGGEVIAPRKIKHILSGRYDGVFGRAVVNGARARARDRSDLTALQRGHTAFWRGGAGSAFHRENIEVRAQLFHTHHARFIDQLCAFVADRPDDHSRLVEIGCGNGDVLRYCAAGLPGLGHFVGLDLNATAVEQARAGAKPDPRVTFVTTDAVHWLAQAPAPGTILLTYGGVLEYLRPDAVQGLFASCGDAAPCTVALVEPVAKDNADFARPGSEIFGKENSFSHNYPQYLAAAGFEIVSSETIYHPELDAMLVMILAHRPLAQALGAVRTA